MEGANDGDKVQRVFTDFKARRSALVKALTDEADDFFGQCDPHAGSALHLFGDSNGQWRVEVPAGNFPPEIPQPTSGINLWRDTRPKKQWLSLVAIHSFAWLGYMATFQGFDLEFNRADWRRLDDMTKELPTLWDVVDDYHTYDVQDLL